MDGGGATGTRTSASSARNAGGASQGNRETGAARRRVGFLDGYRGLSGLDIDEDLVRYWEVMATLGRAVCSLEHGHRFVAGGERAVELALIGRRVAELEIDLLGETDRLAMERAHA